MEQRIQIDILEPEAFTAMRGLEAFLRKSQLKPAHKELIAVRASQINGCAFCLDMHTKKALNEGFDQQQLFLLDAWKETDLFNEEEQAVLALTEEITLIHHQGLTGITYARARSLFSESYVALLIMAVTTINAWNRICASTHKPLPN